MTPRPSHSTTGSRALVLEAPRRLELRRFPLPQLGDDDGLLRVEACGLCGTDHEQYSGALPTAGPVVPGHEVVGVIEHLGPAAAERWGVSAGDRVAVEVFRSCRRCPACRGGDYRHCERHGMRDMVGFVPASVAPALWGGYAEHMYLPADSVLLPVPANLDPVVATLFNPLGAGIRWAVDVPGTGPGDVVAILGPGIRGLSAVAAVRRAGAAYVLVTGAGPRDAPRLQAAQALGADRTVDVTGADPVRALLADVGRLADVVVDVTAKAPAALGQAVGLARPGGTVVCAGTRGATGPPVGFDPDHIVYKELRLLGALGVDAPAYRTALSLLADGGFRSEVLSRRCVGLDGAGRLLSSLADGHGSDGDDQPVHAVVVP